MHTDTVLHLQNTDTLCALQGWMEDARSVSPHQPTLHQTPKVHVPCLKMNDTICTYILHVTVLHACIFTCFDIQKQMSTQ